MGIGTKVRLYQAGKLGDPKALLGISEIGTGHGYCTGQEAVAHFGLGAASRCDVELILPFGKGTIRRRGVAASQRIVIDEGDCSAGSLHP